MHSTTLRALAFAGATLALAGLAGAQSTPSSQDTTKAQRSTMAQDTAHHGARTHRASSRRGTSKPKTVKVKESSPGLAAQATLSADSAQAIALAAVPNGRVREAELEDEKGTLVYSYDIKVRGKSGVEEVNVDAKTGAIVSQNHESAKTERKEEARESGAKRTHKARGAKMNSDSTKTKSDSTMKKDSTTKP